MSKTKRVERLAVGTKMYAVNEHLYYIPGNPAPVKEYCVCEAEVRGFYQGGYVDICLFGKHPGCGIVPYYYPLKDVGTKVFYTPQEAAVLAKQLTEKYEQTWGWTGDPPMRRTWEHLLEE